MQLRAYDDLSECLQAAVSRRCPHCDVFAQMHIQHLPSWEQLQANKPARIAVIVQCDACRLPVFLSSGHVRYEASLITLDGPLESVIKPKDAFAIRLLPPAVQSLTEELFASHRQEQWHALALLSNTLIHACDRALGGQQRLALFNTVTDSAALIDIDETNLRLCRHILFDLETGDTPPPLLDAQAALLIALVKDLLYQHFVRPAELKTTARNA
ncbi:MAG: hypothetical protein AAGJ86_10215 [Pseudomonadota bacterium]